MRVMGTVSRFCCSKTIFLNKHHNFDNFVVFNLPPPDNNNNKKPFRNHLRTSNSLPSLCVKHRPFSGVLASQDSRVELDTLEIKDQETNEDIVIEDVKTVRVKFQLQKDCGFGEQFMIVGDDSLLGSWNPEHALPLNWSDGHLWTVELDLPVGKTILFKFVLKDVVGRFNWQPDPDRVLQTWGTKNTIVIFEDWENAALQIVMEDEPSSNQTEGPSRNAEMLIVAENLTHQEEDEPAKVDKRTEFFYVDSILMEKQSSEFQDGSAAAIVADNIATSNKDIKIVKDGRGDSGGATDVMNSPIIGSEESLFTHEGESVLVPGLPPISGHSSKVAGTNEEQSTATDASLEESEVKNLSVTETRSMTQMVLHTKKKQVQYMILKWILKLNSITRRNQMMNKRVLKMMIKWRLKLNLAISQNQKNMKQMKSSIARNQSLIKAVYSKKTSNGAVKH